MGFIVAERGMIRGCCCWKVWRCHLAGTCLARVALWRGFVIVSDINPRKRSGMCAMDG